jgi:hypothetical protein
MPDPTTIASKSAKAASFSSHSLLVDDPSIAQTQLFISTLYFNSLFQFSISALYFHAGIPTPRHRYPALFLQGASFTGEIGLCDQTFQ